MGTKLKTTKLHKEFGKQIQKLRKERGLTQEDLADEVGVDRSYIGFLERGEKMLLSTKLVKLQKHFTLSLKSYLTFDHIQN